MIKIYKAIFLILFCYNGATHVQAQMAESESYSTFMDTMTLKHYLNQAELLKRNNPDSALLFLQYAQRFFDRPDCYECQSDLLMRIGAIYLKSKHMPEEALFFFKKARTYSAKDTALLIKWNNSMGAGYYFLEQYDSAMFYYSRGLELSLTQNNQPAQTALMCNNISTMLLDRQLYQKALYYLNTAQQLGQRHNLKRNLVTTFQNKAGVYFNLQQFDSMLFYLKKTELLHLPLNAAEQQRQSMLYGLYYIWNGDARKSVYFFRKALEGKAEPELKIIHLNNLAAGYTELGEFEQAIALFKQSLHIIRHDGLTHSAKNLPMVYENLRRMYDTLGNYKEAYRYSKLLNSLKDTIYNTEKEKIINELEAKFRNAEKDKHLSEKQVQLLSAERKLGKRNQWIINIVATALILILSMGIILQRYRLKLQKAKTREEQLKASRIQTAIESEERERSRIGRQLHDEIMVDFSIVKMNIEALTKAHPNMSGLTGYYDISQQLEVACQKLRQAAHNLMPEVLIEEGLLQAVNYFLVGVKNNSGIDIYFQHFGEDPSEQLGTKAVIVYQIIQELVQNAIKHARASRILVQITSFEDSITLSVEDDGIGIADTAKASDGLGIRSIRLRLETLNGRMHITPVKPHGTAVSIEIDMSGWK